jgi:shikimate dehydrogenase
MGAAAAPAVKNMNDHQPNRRFAVIGHPIGHTMSPFIHQRLFELSGDPDVPYEVYDIAPHELAGKMDFLRSLTGFNITIPHKSAIIPFLDACSENARAFGSVNTVSTLGGVSTGYTTDGVGCLRALEAAGVSPRGRNLLLGTGGAARAVAFALAEAALSPQIRLAARSGSLLKARQLCSELAGYLETLGKKGDVSLCTYEELEAGGERFDLLLNCTSVGMYPNAGASPVTRETVARCGAVFDAVYNPDETLLLGYARELGIPAVHGMAMLVWQAAAAHEIWEGVEYRPEDMEALCRDAAREMALRFGEKKPG